MRRVFVGGEGVIKGGRSEKSRESGVFDPVLFDDLRDESVDCGGVEMLSADSTGEEEFMIVVV